MATKQKKVDVILVALAAFATGMVAGAFLMPAIKVDNNPVPVQLAGSFQATMGIPAVDAEENGVLGYLTVEVKPGSGQVLVNVLNLTTLGDTQQSARDAAIAASDFTGKELSQIDIIFNINVNATVIDGPSAGASMAAAVVLALEKKEPRSDIMMTGTIDDQGHIGKVGAVLEKALAAKDGGASVFLVPQGQSQESQTVRTSQCRQNGRFCRVIYKSQDTDISSTVGIKIVEVSTLADAVKQLSGE